MTEAEPQYRVRIEVSTSTKGVHTYSCTVEQTTEQTNGTDCSKITDETLTESDRLVSLLDTRYPKIEA